jgi:Holliday junction resolvase RusA-like endonuclease
MTFAMTFKLEGTPTGKGRPKFARKGNFVSTYTPLKTKNYEDRIREVAREAMGSSEPLETPITVCFYITMPVPASYSKKAKTACLLGETRPTKKPDVDNIIKAFLDAMNGIVYLDDCQVVDLHAKKVYGTVGMVEVYIKESLN